MKMLNLGAEFMCPLWEPEIEQVGLAESHNINWSEITFAYAMNMAGTQPEYVRDLRNAAKKHGVPTVWHSIEDPNSFETFVEQAEGFDVIATSDRECIPKYWIRYPQAKVIWLPLAAQPKLHYPRPHEGTRPLTDTILLANWYTGRERLEQVRTVVEPVVDAGIPFRLFAYPTHRWPAKYEKDWAGATGPFDVGRFYPEGKIALGISNQCHRTTMCSMRIFEAMACGLPLVAAVSDAFQSLGLEHGKHLMIASTPAEAIQWVRLLLEDPVEAQVIAECGRQFILEYHTYSNRLAKILETIQ